MNKRTILKYEDLSNELKARALNYFVNQLIVEITEHGLRFNDELNEDKLQARIDKALLKAEKLRTPWFAGELILETCKKDLASMAICDAEEARYSLSADGKTFCLRQVTFTKISGSK